jgi:hypothetical protein
MLHLLILAVSLLSMSLISDAFVLTPATTKSNEPGLRPLFAIMGPIASAKKAMDPQDYNRVVQQKMKQEGLTREQAEDEYNAFLENPIFYYALDKKEEYYKSLGYKDMIEGMIGEAEKEGRGDEVRERIAQFRKTNQVKAYSVLVAFILSFGFAYNLYHQDPANFLPGLPIHE